MQLTEMTQRNLQALKEKLHNKRCDICYHSMIKYSAPIIKHGKESKLSSIQCMTCLTVYNNNLEIEWIGISEIEGDA